MIFLIEIDQKLNITKIVMNYMGGIGQAVLITGESP